MKKIFVCFLCLFLALVCVTNFFGFKDSSYQKALHGSVQIVNGIGFTSKQILHGLFGGIKYDYEELEGLPYAYHWSFDSIKNSHACALSASECLYSNDEDILYLVKSAFCTDYAYYIERKDKNNFLNGRYRDTVDRLINGSGEFGYFGLFNRNKLTSEEEELYSQIYIDYILEGCSDSIDIPVGYGGLQAIYYLSQFECNKKGDN